MHIEFINDKTYMNTFKVKFKAKQAKTKRAVAAAAAAAVVQPEEAQAHVTALVPHKLPHTRPAAASVCLFYCHSKSVWSNLIGHAT